MVGFDHTDITFFLRGLARFGPRSGQASARLSASDRRRNLVCVFASCGTAHPFGRHRRRHCQNPNTLADAARRHQRPRTRGPTFLKLFNFMLVFKPFGMAARQGGRHLRRVLWRWRAPVACADRGLEASCAPCLLRCRRDGGWYRFAGSRVPTAPKEKLPPLNVGARRRHARLGRASCLS
jgi:hypothetical protein